jgi:hypothetical protein
MGKRWEKDGWTNFVIEQIWEKDDVLLFSKVFDIVARWCSCSTKLYNVWIKDLN